MNEEHYSRLEVRKNGGGLAIQLPKRQTRFAVGDTVDVSLKYSGRIRPRCKCSRCGNMVTDYFKNEDMEPFPLVLCRTCFEQDGWDA